MDEADIDLVSPPGTSKANKRPNPDALSNGRVNKRKPGPLPRDLVVRRPSLSDITPPQSPTQPISSSPVPWLVHISHYILNIAQMHYVKSSHLCIFHLHQV